MGVCQIALSTPNRARSVEWYADVLGYVPTGDVAWEHHPPGSDVVQGLGSARYTEGWAIDSQEFFQLEFFTYEQPVPRPRPAGWRPSDIGYNMVTIHVDDLDATLGRARLRGNLPLTAPAGPPGERRVCLHDLDGVLLELTELDRRTPTPGGRPRAALGVAARALRASVPDLDEACEFFVGALGMHSADAPLHTSEDEALWGLEGASRRTATLWLGDFWLELVQYQDPVGAPRPQGYRVSDLGILNFALGCRSPELYRDAVARALASGLCDAAPELGVAELRLTYVMNHAGFSVELIYVNRSMDERAGYGPGGRQQSGRPRQAPHT